MLVSFWHIEHVHFLITAIDLETLFVFSLAILRAAKNDEWEVKKLRSLVLSFDFDLEAEQALLDDLDWDEYNNPINDLSLDFDSTLSSPTEWAQDPTEWWLSNQKRFDSFELKPLSGQAFSRRGDGQRPARSSPSANWAKLRSTLTRTRASRENCRRPLNVCRLVFRAPRRHTPWTIDLL